MSRVQRNIPIGKWVVIEKVHMTTAGGQYKTTHHPYKMNISDETVVRGSDLSDDRIFLNLSDYSQIGNDPKELSFLIGTVFCSYYLIILNISYYFDYYHLHTDLFNFLTDVMGKIHDFGDVLTVRAQGEDRKRVQFRLMDTRFDLITSLCAS